MLALADEARTYLADCRRGLEHDRRMETERRNAARLMSAVKDRRELGDRRTSD